MFYMQMWWGTQKHHLGGGGVDTLSHSIIFTTLMIMTLHTLWCVGKGAMPPSYACNFLCCQTFSFFFCTFQSSSTQPCRCIYDICRRIHRQRATWWNFHHFIFYLFVCIFQNVSRHLLNSKSNGVPMLSVPPIRKTSDSDATDYSRASIDKKKHNPEEKKVRIDNNVFTFLRMPYIKFMHSKLNSYS